MDWSEPGLLILSSLAGGAKHGYAVTKDVAETTGISLGPGTLYAALTRLEGRGLIEPVASDDRRRPYRLTDAGRAELQAQAAAMQRFAKQSLRRLSARVALS